MVSVEANAVPAKLPKVIAYLPPELKKDLERLAEIEDRSVSNMVLIAIREIVNKAKKEGKFQSTEREN